MTSPIQIAGIHDLDEALLIAQAGANFLGFPKRLDTHREDISDEAAAQVIRALPPGVGAVIITYLEEAGAIVALSDTLGTKNVQLHAPLTQAELRRLREMAPDLFLIKSLIVRNTGAADLAEEAASYAPYVDAFLTDTFDPETGASGATGKTHDWEISRRLVAATPKPVILAGGLTPENVAQAIRTVRPWGVDAHTGVEGEGGRKDPLRVKRFVEEAGRAFRQLRGT